MGESTKEHLKSLLESFDTAMLVTEDGDELHARPMAVADLEEASTLWFVTSRETPKSYEIQRDRRVSVTFQSSARYVALSGVADLVDDRARIHRLWKPSWRVWFPNGADDPQLVLIRVTVTDAELWDNAGSKGIRYAFEAAKALLRREAPAPVEGQHGRVQPQKDAAVPPSRH